MGDPDSSNPVSVGNQCSTNYNISTCKIDGGGQGYWPASRFSRQTNRERPKRSLPDSRQHKNKAQFHTHMVVKKEKNESKTYQPGKTRRGC